MIENSTTQPIDSIHLSPSFASMEKTELVNVIIALGLGSIIVMSSLFLVVALVINRQQMKKLNEEDMEK
jgi:hypothetical protein